VETIASSLKKNDGLMLAIQMIEYSSASIAKKLHNKYKNV
jgi:hypothetical protein